MGKFTVKIAIFAVLAFAGTAPVHAQNRTNTDWNRVLDRYEQICGLCISMKADVQSGKQVSASNVSSLFQELGQLRSQLQNAQGSMTESQLKRFNAIRDSYSSQMDAPNPQNSQSPEKGKSPQNSQSPNDSRYFQPARQTAVSKPANTQARTDRATDALQENIALPHLETISSGIAYPDSKVHIPPFEVPFQAANMPIVTEVPVLPAPKMAGNSWQLQLLGLVSIDAIPQYGMLSALGKQHFGLVLGAQSNFRTIAPKYDCLSDGTIPGTGYFWGDGQTANTRFSVLAGMYWSPKGKLAVYANSGYASTNRYWHDTKGRWARVSDISTGGALFGMGIILPVRHLSLTSGFQYDNSSKALSWNAGIGYRFGMTAK